MGLYERWMRPQEKTKEEIGRTIVLEQYLNVINPELKSWITQRSPASAEQAVAMAEAFVAARQAEGTFRLGKPDASRQIVECCQLLVLYPMPRADELIERLGKARFLSTLALCKGYWQVPLSQASRKLTAFRKPSGLYHFLTMPFRLQGATASFQRLMDEVLRGKENFAAAYIDDVVVYSSSWKEHLRHLSIVLKINEAGLTANPSKCHLSCKEVSYLGYILGGGQIRPQVDKVEAVRATPQPTTKRRVCSFLGLAGWYCRFIRNFSTIAAPLTNLTKKDMPQRVKWPRDCENAFNELKNALCGEPVLASPDFFLVQTDASGLGLGAVLLQDEGEDRKPILYISRKLFLRKVRYSTIEKEALAIK
ncbi:hypothetical protein NFI96_000908 [Prochilodus magdalenae]|nr:hypothetical protein NFI96_000908 [Prochilodus magdalenae]